MKEIVNTLSNPGIFLFPLLFVFLYLISKPGVWSVRAGGVFFGVSGVLLALSISDNNFQRLVSEPDSIPAGMLLFLLAFFLWTGLRQAHENDRRISLGNPPAEKGFREKVASWPDLVYIELISMVLMTCILIAWSLLANAPLEEWADPAVSPNPSKAPWYFLGLQELLVYFDPWIAGVVIPALIIFGLMAIPYIDSSPKEYSGYYSFSGRKFSLLLFLGGFFFWVILIVTGTFLRGKNWNFYGPFENRELVKESVAELVNLSDIVWKNIFGMPAPSHWLAREAFGIVPVTFYLFFLPPIIKKLLSKKKAGESRTGICRRLVRLARYFMPEGEKRELLTLFLLFWAAGVLVKIFLRLLFNIKYVVYIPELLLNI